MKNIKLLLIALLLFCINAENKVFSQSTDATNVRNATRFLGWNSSGTAGSLEIRNDFNQAINFSTNGSQRATLLATGDMGLGLTIPQSRLHINTNSAANTFSQFTNSNTGNLSTDGFQVGIGSTGNAEFWQRENLPMVFFKRDATNALERLRITNNSTGVTRVGISYGQPLGSGPIVNPQAMLHLGTNTPTNQGYRNWMNVGTFMGSGPNILNDFMYAGLYEKNYGNDAIVAWGNSRCFSEQTPGVDIHYFRILSLTPSTCGDGGSGTDGLETMRITPSGSVGIGDFLTLGEDPSRTLDVAGNAAIRTITNNNSLNRVLVVDNNNKGLIQYRDLSTLGFASVCTTGTTNRLTRFTNANSICNSIIFDNGTRAGINTTSPGASFDVNLNSTSLVNIGIRSIVLGASTSNNIGGYFEASSCAAQNIGVSAFAVNPCGPAYAVYSNGDIGLTGSVINLSDKKFKDNIVGINGALDILEKIEAKQYEYKTRQYAQLSMPKGNHYGFIAQEVEAILPNMVQNFIQPPVVDSLGKIVSDSVSFKGVNYIEFIPLLVKGINEQQAVIDSLTSLVATKNAIIDSRLNYLESKLVSCCGASQRRMANPNTEEDNASNQKVELNNLQAIVLEQNVPNPFAEQTTISYNIPTDAQSALMVFYDMNGRKIKETNVEKGAGNISVFAPNLSKGIYSYSLIIDGKVIETKKMIKGN